jgi:hypothetical protein
MGLTMVGSNVFVALAGCAISASPFFGLALARRTKGNHRAARGSGKGVSAKFEIIFFVMLQAYRIAISWVTVSQS